jgi:TctA family transporter
MPAKAFSPIVGGVFLRKVTEARVELFKNALPPMVLTLAGMVILVSLGQRKKAPDLISITVSGRVTLAKLAQSANALAPIVITPFGITIAVKAPQPWNR